MVTVRKRLESIERDVIPSMFVGVMIRDDEWLAHILDDILPNLEERALRLAKECKENGECTEDETLCDETHIKAVFVEAKNKFRREHLLREERTMSHH